MQISQYIIIRPKHRWGYTSRLAHTKPSLNPDEVAVKVSIELPDAIFEKPSLEATIVIPEDAVSSPVIEAEVVGNIEEIIKQNTGFKVKLEIVEPDNEEK